MYAILLPLGVISAVAGLVLIGFGVPIKEFTLGNTLIIAGTTAFTGGLVVVGIAAAVRQLNRIANALASRPPVAAGRPARSPEPEAPPVVARAAAPPQPQRGRAQPAPKPPEQPVQQEPPPVYAPIPSVVPPAPLPEEMPAVARPRPNVFALGRGAEAPAHAEPDIPMPQVVAPRAPAARPVPTAEVAPEPKFTPTEAPPWVANNGGASQPPLTAPADMRPVPEPKPAERPARSSPFDAVWPARARPGKTATAEAPRAAEVEPDPREAAAAEERRELARVVSAEPRQPEPRQVSILKSGVIDGMAYTLYTDGSIEAQLPQGTMRFASIEELRVYLEQNP
jgi:hypothetical protein